MQPEVEEMRLWLYGLLDIPRVGTVVDLGCGAGEDLKGLGQRNPFATFLGVDRFENQIRQSQSETVGTNLNFLCVDISNGLPLKDEEADVLYSVNLVECLPNTDAFVAECHRVLKQNGQIVMAHFDWDTQTFDGEDRALVRKIVHAFNDWQQGWMQSVDPWAGRRLKRYFAKDNLFTGDVKTYTLTSTSFEPGSYGRRQAESFEALVGRGLVEQEEYDAFMRFQREAADRAAFLFSVTMFAFVGTKCPK